MNRVALATVVACGCAAAPPAATATADFLSDPSSMPDGAGRPGGGQAVLLPLAPL